MKIITISRDRMERASESERLTEKDLGKKLLGQGDAYHLTINTGNWNIKDMAPTVADFARSWFGGKS